VGEKVFFTGASQTVPNVGKVVHGQRGEVTGPCTGDEVDTCVAVRFPGNTDDVDCYLTEVSRLRAASAADPPRACAPHARDAAHAPCVPTTASAAAPQPSHCTRSRAHRSPLPGCVRDGGRGRGAGGPLRWQRQGGRRPRPSPPYSLRLVAVRAQVSRGAPPPLPGGYTVGEKVFYTGSSQTWDDGDKVAHGQQGEVVGPGTGDDGDNIKRVNVLFPGNKANINCRLTEVRRLRAAPAADPPRACAPHTRDAAHAPCVPTTASAAAPQPLLHAQPRAPQSPLPGCVRDGVAEGVVRAGRLGGSTRMVST
jgi:hypothetical protein